MPPQPCPPKVRPCDECGKDHVYVCGQIVFSRDPTKKEEACLGGLQICAECIEPFKDFARRAYDARARRKEFKFEA